VYAAAALMEWQGERGDKVPRNIFELGLRHFLGEPGYVAAYAGWLVAAGDAANARALFERALAAAPPPEAARALWDHYLTARRAAPRPPARLQSAHRTLLAAEAGPLVTTLHSPASASMLQHRERRPVPR